MTIVDVWFVVGYWLMVDGLCLIVQKEFDEYDMPNCVDDASWRET